MTVGVPSEPSAAVAGGWIEQQEASRAACLAEWPDAETGAYNPRCCRWPKSCSVETPPFHPHDPRACPAGSSVADCLVEHRPAAPSVQPLCLCGRPEGALLHQRVPETAEDHLYEPPAETQQDDGEVCPNCHGSRMALCGLPCDTCLDTGTRAGYERWKGVVLTAPSEPPAADSPTPGTRTACPICGSPAIQRPEHPDARWCAEHGCYLAAAPSPVDTTEPPAETQQDDEPPTDPPTVLREAIDELDRLGDEHWQQGDALSRVIDGFRLWAEGRADELTVRRPCPYGCEGGHTDYEYDDQHRNPEGGPW